MGKLSAPDKCVRGIFKNGIKHQNKDHQCKYLDGECNYKGIKFLEKVEMNLNGLMEVLWKPQPLLVPLSTPKKSVKFVWTQK